MLSEHNKIRDIWVNWPKVRQVYDVKLTSISSLLVYEILHKVIIHIEINFYLPIEHGLYKIYYCVCVLTFTPLPEIFFFLCLIIPKDLRGFCPT